MPKKYINSNKKYFRSIVIIKYLLLINCNIVKLHFKDRCRFVELQEFVKFPFKPEEKRHQINPILANVRIPRRIGDRVFFIRVVLFAFKVAIR